MYVIMCACMLDYLQRNGEVSSLDDCIDDDGDVDNLHLMDSDADDEFECDCPVCQIHQQRISGIYMIQYGDAGQADCIK